MPNDTTRDAFFVAGVASDGASLDGSPVSSDGLRFFELLVEATLSVDGGVRVDLFDRVVDDDDDDDDVADDAPTVVGGKVA